MNKTELAQIKVVVYEAIMPIKDEVSSLRQDIEVLNQKLCGNGYAKRIQDIEDSIRPLVSLRWKLIGAFLLLTNIIGLVSFLYTITR